MSSCQTFAAFATIRRGIVGVEARLSDFTFPPHSHDHVCIGLMRAGEKSSRYGLRRHTVGPGDVILVNPGDVHDGRSVGRVDRAYTMLEIDGAAFARICREGIGKDGLEFGRPVLGDPRVSAALARWIALLRAGSAEGDAAASRAAAERDAAALVLGTLSWRGAEGGTVPLTDAAGRDIAWRVVRRMREREAGVDAMQDLAREVGASRFQVIRAFHRTFGLSPEAYRRQVRIQRARALLAGPDRLADIAQDAGFTDQSHMTREFRRFVGLTPAAYRAAFRPDPVPTV